MKRHLRLSCLALLAAQLYVATAHAATNSFTNATLGTDYATPGFWSLGNVPTGTDRAIIGLDSTRSALYSTAGSFTSTDDLVLGNGTGTAASGTLTMSTSAGTLTFNRVILTESSNAGNTATLTMNAGSLIVTAGSGDGTGLIFGGGGVVAGSSATFDLNGGMLTTKRISEYSGGVAVNSTFNFNGGTLVAGASNATFMSGLNTANVKNGGAIIDTNGQAITIGQALLHFAGATTDKLTKNGNGTLTLTGANTYSGGTTVNTGTLSIGAGSADAPGALVINSGGTVTNSAASNNFFDGFTSTTINAGGTLTAVGGATGMNPVTMNGGTLAYGGTPDANFGSWGFHGNGATDIFATASSNITAIGMNSENAAGVKIDVSSGQTLTVSGTFTAPALRPVYALTKIGTGTLTLTGANTYTGNTIVNGGTLNQNAGSYSGAGRLWLGNGVGNTGTMTVDGTTGTLTFNSTAFASGAANGIIIGKDGGNGTLNVSAGTVTVGTTTGDIILASDNNGATSSNTVGTLNVSGGSVTAGRLIMSDDNGAVTTVTISGGSITAQSMFLARGGFGGSMTSSTVNLNGGTISTTAVKDVVGGTGTSTWNFNGGTLRALANDTTFLQSWTRANVRDGGAKIDTNGFNVTATQVLSHSNIGLDNAIDGGLTKNGSGTLTLSGTNTYTGGTVVNGGTLTGTVTAGFAGGAAPAFGTGSITINSGATVTGSAAFTVAGGNANTRTINIIGGTLDTKYSGTGGEYLANLSLTGGTILNSASSTDYVRVAFNGVSGLQITSNAASTSSTISTGIDMTQGSITANVALGTVPGGSDLIISGKITENTGAGSGAKTITKNGAGTLVLSGANVYTGATTIDGGTLALNATGMLFNTTNGILGPVVNVNSGTTLSVRNSFNTGYSAAYNVTGGTINITNGTSADGSNYMNSVTLTSGAAISGNSVRTGFHSNSTFTVSGTSASTISSGITLVFQSGVGTQATFNVADVTSNANADLTVSGVISDLIAGLQVFKTGPGTMTLTGVNTYTGTTTINGGTLTLNAAGMLFNTTKGILGNIVNVNSGTTLNVANSFNTGYSAAYNVTGGTINISNGTSADGGTYMNNVTLTSGATLSGNSVRTGFHSNSTFTVSGSSASTISSGIALVFQSGVGTQATFNVADVTSNANVDLTISGVISDLITGLRVIKTGPGTVSLTNTGNSWDGGLSLNGGVVSVSQLTAGNTNGQLGGWNGTSGFFSFDGGTLQYTGGTVSGINRAFTINAGGATIDVTQPGTNVTWSDASGAGPIIGAGRLTKIGSGTLTFSGTANTWSGGLSINGGTISVAQLAGGNTASSIGAAIGTSGNFSFDGGTLQYTGGTVSGINRAFTINAGGATIDVTQSGTNLTWTDASGAGPIIGSGPFTKIGAGTLTFSGANTFTGNVAVNGGILRFGISGNGNPITSGPLGPANTAVTKVVVASGATLDVNGANDTTYGVTIAGTGSAAQGALINSGANTSSGAIQTPNIKLAANATIGGTGNFNMIAAGFGANTLDLSGFTLTKAGTNTFSMANTTVTAGTVKISGGTLSQTSTGSNGSAAAFTLDDTAGAALSLNNLNLSVGSLAGGGTTGGNVALGSGTLTVGNLGTSTTYAGVISGSGAVTKIGAGTLTLTGTNLYTGPTNVLAGSLTLNGSIQFSSLTTIGDGVNPATLNGNGTTGPLTIAANATHRPGNSPGLTNVVGNYIENGALVIEFNGTGNAGPGVAVNGYSQVKVTGGGSVTLGGTSSLSVIYTGSGFSPSFAQKYTIIDNDGDLSTDTSGTFGNYLNEGMTINVGGTDLKLYYHDGGSPDQNNVVLVATGTAASGSTLFVNNEWTTNQTVNGDAEAGSPEAFVDITAFSSVANLLAAQPGFTGNVVLNGGSYAAALLAGSGNVQLRLVNDVDNTQPNVTIQSLSGDATDSIVLNYHAAGAGQLTVEQGSFAGVISEGSSLSPGTLTKTTTGTLVFSGNNSYTGATSVGDGVLEVGSNNALGTADGSTTVTSGATLRLAVNSYATAEPLTLNGAGYVGLTESGALLVDSGTRSFAGQITLGSNATIGVYNGSELTLTGGIAKAGNNVTFLGDNTGSKAIINTAPISGIADVIVDAMIVDLDVANTYDGPTLVQNGGVLNLNVTNALPSPTFSNVTIQSGSTLNRAGATSNTAASLALNNGAVAGSGTLVLAGTVTSDNTSSMNGGVTNLGGNRAFTVNTGTLSVNDSLIGAGNNLTKQGAGTMVITGANTYSGQTNVAAGLFHMAGGSLQNSAVHVTAGVFQQTAGTNNVTGTGGDLTVTGGGQYQLRGGELNFGDYISTDSAWTPSDTSSINLTSGNQFEFTGGSLVNVSNIVVTGSTFTQNDTFGNSHFYVGQNGTGPAAETTIDGGYSLLGGVLDLDVFGDDLTPEQCCDNVANNNDQLTVSGNVLLESTVSLHFAPGYEPEFGDVFTLVCADNIDLGPGFHIDGGFFRIVPSTGDPNGPMALQAIVPEPASIAVWTLVGLAGVGGAFKMRRKRKTRRTN